MAKGPDAKSAKVSKPEKGTKVVASEELPSRHSQVSITGGDPVNRAMGQYGKKAAPAGGLDLFGKS